MSVQAPERGPFRAATVLALVLAGVFAMAAFLALSAYAPDLKARRGGGAHALSTSALGYAGLVRLLQLTGQPVVVSRSAYLTRSYGGFMMLTPQAPGQLGKLGLERDRLIVLPKWAAPQNEDHPGWAGPAFPMPPEYAAAVPPASLGALTVHRRAEGEAGPVRLTSGFSLWPADGAPLGPIRQFQTLSGGDLKPMIKDEAGREVLGMAPGGHVFVLSDPDLLDTQGLADPRTARAALLIMLAMRDDGAPIDFDVSLAGVGGERNLLRLAIEPPFLGATLCLLAAAALVGVQAWSRFGPPAPSAGGPPPGKTALVENGASMIRLARREPRMARRYVRLCRQRAAAALGAANLEGADLDAFLDRWASQVGAQGRIGALAAEADQVKAGGDLVALARKARRWRLEMTREPG